LAQLKAHPFLMANLVGFAILLGFKSQGGFAVDLKRPNRWCKDHGPMISSPSAHLGRKYSIAFIESHQVSAVAANTQARRARKEGMSRLVISSDFACCLSAPALQAGVLPKGELVLRGDQSVQP
jgi:hypothetical protein